MSSYNDYYGFGEAPFSLTPDPRFAYSAKSHERALETVLHALTRREGLIVVTGGIGCGKTMLCRRLIPLLAERTFLSLVLNPFLAADDLLKQVLQDYGLVSTDDARRGFVARTSGHDLVRTLADFLKSLSQINGTAIIIVDEAQNLPLRTLEQIRLLLNFETATSKLLQIILVGQDNLEPILELEEMRQLDQRVSRRCRIGPLSATEVAAYVNYRLTTATIAPEPPSVKFNPDSLSVISRLSHGVPRVINLLCDRALEIGHGKEARSIDSRIALAAADDLELSVPARIRINAAVSRPYVRAAIGLAVIAIIGITALAQQGRLAGLGSAARLTSTGAVTRQRDVEIVTPPVPPDSQPIASKAAPPPTAVIDAAPSFELIVASFATIGRARTVAGELHTAGYPARMTTSTSGRWQMIIVGPYSSLPEANAAKDALEKSGFSGIRIAQFQ